VSAIDEDYQKLKRSLSVDMNAGKQQPLSREYQSFRAQYLPPHLSFYEKACSVGASLHINPSEAEKKRYEEAIETCHLNITPQGAVGLAILSSFFLLLLALLAGALPMIATGEFSYYLFILLTCVAFGVYLPIKNLPFTFAARWRVQASNQMVLGMFYITTYMRHTSNLENAVNFAADHIGPPLSLDLKKVIWNVQTEKFANVQESLDNYLLRWRTSNLEFVEAMNLVQASLYETSQDRRLNSLEKAMNLMLEETYEKMLHYAQDLKSPMTMLHMLGVILPILGLVILPLAMSFMEEIKWYHIAVLYNLLLPVGVFYLGKSILSARPSGYGNTDITDVNPELKKYRNRVITLPGGKQYYVSAAVESALIGGVLLFLGLLPIILHLLAPGFDFPSGDSTFKLLGYREANGTTIGPYGLGASILSLFITLGVGLGLAHYYNVRSKRIIEIRNEAKSLEQEFAGAIFQLGNRLGDGLPAEIAFGKVAEVMQGTKSGEFFTAVAVNIQKMGMSVEQAIFDPKRGALLLYPSPLIESSMKVLIESSKKGPLEASQSLITMSSYIKEIHRVEERLKDLMSDVISGMKSQINFLTPAIAGIVIGITSMITTILGQLNEQMSKFGSDSVNLPFPPELLGNGIPTYYFQAIVGLYVIQITWILAYLVNGIENSQDALNEEYEQGRGLRLGVTLYVVLSLIVIIIFNSIAGSILTNF
jgi:hypothetical protein